MPLPTFVIVGAQKSGTTTLHDWLGQVDGVWVSSPKELHYFDKLGKLEKLGRTDPDWYPRQFTPGPDDVAWGESSPRYLYQDDARAAMAAALPEARFIAILREPVSRAYSQYWFARRKKTEKLETFEAAIQAEERRRAAHPGAQPAVGSYLDRGRYYRQLVDLADRVGRERIQVHLTDDLRSDPIGVLKRTCAFIGASEPDPDVIVWKSKNTFAAPTINSENPRYPAGPIEGQSGDAYPPLDPDLARALRAGFAEDNAKLAEWLGRDLSHWS